MTMISTTQVPAAERRTWPTLPRRAPARSPLESILGERVDAAFTPAQIERLRAHVASSIPPLPDVGLDQFLGTLMDNPAIVSAYFRPTRVCLPAQRQPLMQVVLPFDFALEAARKAAAAPTLQPQERALAWLAAFTYPVAHFHAADTSRGPEAFLDMIQLTRLNELREALVEDALRALRRRHLGLAGTLGATLGFGASESFEPQQVARLASAVRLATLRIEQLWKDVGYV